MKKVEDDDASKTTDGGVSFGDVPGQVAIGNNITQIRIEKPIVPIYPKFIDWRVYFSKNEKDLLPISVSKIPVFENYIDIARRFVLSQTKNILLIQSLGGYGKSHLLREIAHVITEIDAEKQVLMITPGFIKIEDALKEEILNGKEYILIFDDADRFLDEIKSILSFIKYENKSVKVILALRTSGLHVIYDIISQLRCEELYEEIKISRWPSDDLIQLLRLVTAREKIDDEEIIVNTYPIPYLIVWIGKQIKREPTLEFEKIKEKFVNEINYETERCLKEFDSVSQIQDFIMHIACIVPFSMEDETLLNILGKSSGQDIDKIRNVLENLEKAGILRVVGNSLRFNPDMKGDLYLAYRLKGTTDDSINKLMEKWFPVCAERLLINLDAASKYDNLNALESVLSRLVNSWIEGAESTSGYVRKEKLNLIEKIADIVPENCLDLLYVYLIPLPVNLDPKAFGIENKILTTDDYGPLILKLMKNLSLRTKIMEIIEKVDEKIVDGTYDNYKAYGLAKYSVSPLKNSKDLIYNTLDIFQEWLDKPNDSRIKIISAALSEIMVGEHEYTRYGFGKLTWGMKGLKDTPEILKIRDKGLDILKKMIQHKSSNVKLAGIQIAKDIGRTFGRVKENELPLANIISKERKSIVDEIKQFITSETDFQILYAIENLFLEWWAQEKSGTDQVNIYVNYSGLEALSVYGCLG